LQILLEKNSSVKEDISNEEYFSEMRYPGDMAKSARTTEIEELISDERITLWGLLVEAHALITSKLTEELQAATGVPNQWFEVLLRIGRSPGQAVPMTALANMVTFSSGGFTKLADRMEAAGLIKRMPCPGDRRSLLATLTDEGREVLRQGLEVHVPGLERHVLAHLSERDRSQLERILRTLRSAHTDCPG
jgi:DNA-binding MarR family transcriptional regulator